MKKMNSLNLKKNYFQRKKIVLYDAGGNRFEYESITHCAKSLHLKATYVSYHLNKHNRIGDFRIYYKTDDPLSKPAVTYNEGIPAEYDLPVIMFDRYDQHVNLGRFESVTFLAKCLSRNVHDVLGWVKGTKRCTDTDCIYKYEKDCTPEELNNKFRPE